MTLPWLFDLCRNSFLLIIFPVPCIAALLLPLLITEERKEREEEFEEEEGRVVLGCWVLREAELRLKFKIEDCDCGLLPANEPTIQNVRPVSIQRNQR